MVVLFITSLASGYLLAGLYFSPSTTDIQNITTDGGWLNILLLGVDARSKESTGRTDTMILCSIEPKTGQIRLLSIPRDTRVNLPKHGWNKINAANVYGGPELAMASVSELLGTTVNYYAIIDFNSFKKVIDILGGVDYNVEQDMYLSDDEFPSLTINLKKGLHHFDGEQALQYVRYRSYLQGDVDRTLHQQKFLVALADQELRLGTLTKLPSLVPELLRDVKTNMSNGDIYQLVGVAVKIKQLDIATQTLPGYPVNIAGGSYWAVDPAKAKLVMDSLYRGEKLEVVEKSPVDPRIIGATSYYKAPPDDPDDKIENPDATDPNKQLTNDPNKKPVTNTTTTGVKGTTGTGLGVTSSDKKGSSVALIPQTGATSTTGTNTNSSGSSSGSSSTSGSSGNSSNTKTTDTTQKSTTSPKP